MRFPICCDGALSNKWSVFFSKNVWIPPRLSLLPTISLDLIIKSASSMKEEIVPSGWNSDMTHWFRRDHVPTSVSLNSANFQSDVLRVFAMLEPRLVASYCDVLK